MSHFLLHVFITDWVFVVIHTHTLKQMSGFYLNVAVQVVLEGISQEDTLGRQSLNSTHFNVRFVSMEWLNTASQQSLSADVFSVVSPGEFGFFSWTFNYSYPAVS